MSNQGPMDGEGSRCCSTHFLALPISVAGKCRSENRSNSTALHVTEFKAKKKKGESSACLFRIIIFYWVTCEVLGRSLYSFDFTHKCIKNQNSKLSRRVSYRNAC